MRRALAALDSVHGDGQLPGIPVMLSRGSTRLGEYEYQRSGRAVRIRVSARVSDPGLALLHEVGHFLDQQALDGGISFFHASANATRLAAWRTAVRNTEAVHSLARLQAQKRLTVDRRQLAYLLRIQEIWARSYAQYIALQSGDQELAQQLEALLIGQRRATIPVMEQWEMDDFAPVADAMDRLFSDLGWRQ